jgi:hypothetical protein
MTGNFTISTDRSNDNLHISLSGDFDGKSADQLLHLLQGNPREVSNVFINTDRVNHIYPSGMRAFQEKIDFLLDQNMYLFFTGKNAERLVPSAYMMGICG